MDHYAGIDVSLECSSVCVVDTSGKIVREGKVATQPEALIGYFGPLGVTVVRIGLGDRPRISLRSSRATSQHLTMGGRHYGAE
jgi:hypothetical protein